MGARPYNENPGVEARVRPLKIKNRNAPCESCITDFYYNPYL